MYEPRDDAALPDAAADTRGYRIGPWPPQPSRPQPSIPLPADEPTGELGAGRRGRHDLSDPLDAPLSDFDIPGWHAPEYPQPSSGPVLGHTPPADMPRYQEPEYLPAEPAEQEYRRGRYAEAEEFRPAGPRRRARHAQPEDEDQAGRLRQSGDEPAGRIRMPQAEEPTSGRILPGDEPAGRIRMPQDEPSGRFRMPQPEEPTSGRMRTPQAEEATSGRMRMPQDEPSGQIRIPGEIPGEESTSRLRMNQGDELTGRIRMPAGEEPTGRLRMAPEDSTGRTRASREAQPNHRAADDDQAGRTRPGRAADQQWLSRAFPQRGSEPAEPPPPVERAWWLDAPVDPPAPPAAPPVEYPQPQVADEPTGQQQMLPPPAPPSAPPSRQRLDAESVLAAVRDVPGLRAADLRTDQSGGRTLKLDVAEGADPDEVTAAANRALHTRLGLDAHLAVAATVVPDSAEDAEGRPVVLTEETPRRSEPRAIIERVQVATAGAECAVEVCLSSAGIRAVGRAGGPSLDTYLLRVAAMATGDAIGVLAAGRARCAVEHVDMVAAGTSQVVLVVLVLMAGDAAERLVGSALAGGDPRHAAVRATLAALNRRLAPLLAR